MSLDTCADQFLLALGDDAQIVAVSPLAEENDSFLRMKAKRFPKARPNAEEILPRRPDVALRVWGGTPKLADTLDRLGVKVVTLGYAADFDAVKANIRAAAEALGRRARGEAMIADLDARLAALAKRPLYPHAALYVTPGGVTAGAGTMIDSIFQAARVKNAAAEAGAAFWTPLPAEALALHPPSLIVTGFFTADRELIGHWSIARHPALREIFSDTPTVHLSADTISCPAWFAVDAAEAIAAGVDAMETRHAAR